MKKIKAFTIPHETWYNNSILDELRGNPLINIGIYYEYGGTDGEFHLVWDGIGIQLQAYNDSWAVLTQMPELIDLMGRIQIEELKPTISEFAEMLKGIGFQDITERVEGEKVTFGEGTRKK